VFPRDIPDVRK